MTKEMKKRIARKQTELREYHAANGVIRVRQLPAGTRIELHTSDEHYELEVGTPKRGVVLIASDVRFEGRDKAIVLGSTDPDTRIYLPQIIGEGLQVSFKFPYKPTVRTRPILSARILGKNDSYSYDMWRDV